MDTEEYPYPFNLAPCTWGEAEWAAAYEQLESYGLNLCIRRNLPLPDCLAAGLARAAAWLARQTKPVPKWAACFRVKGGALDCARALGAKHKDRDPYDEARLVDEKSYERLPAAAPHEAMIAYFAKVGMDLSGAFLGRTDTQTSDERAQRMFVRNLQIYPLAFFIARYWGKAKALEDEFVGAAPYRKDAERHRLFLRRLARLPYSELQSSWKEIEGFDASEAGYRNEFTLLLHTAPHQFCRKYLRLRHGADIRRNLHALLRDQPDSVEKRFLEASK